jgi:hypothetical protein
VPAPEREKACEVSWELGHLDRPGAAGFQPALFVGALAWKVSKVEGLRDGDWERRHPCWHRTQNGHRIMTASCKKFDKLNRQVLIDLEFH